MSANPAISVVIPTMNRASVLPDALRCALAQREVDLEVVVVDDGSTDRTADAVEAVGDERVRYVRQENTGICGARNRGIDMARGEWLAFLDDDDLWVPTKLARQTEACGSRRTWATCHVAVTDWDLELVMVQPSPGPEAMAAALRRTNAVPGGGSGAIVHRRLLDTVGPFDTSLRHVGDWEMWCRLAAAAQPAVVDESLLAYRRHGGQLSTRRDEIADEVAELAARGLVDAEAVDERRQVQPPTTTGAVGATARLARRAVLARQAAVLGQATVDAAERAIEEIQAVLDR